MLPPVFIYFTIFLGGRAEVFINLTHRNWTAVGVPGRECLPIVDPRGLVTPLFDSWSLDMWLFSGGKDKLLPSKAPRAKQYLEMEDDVSVVTNITNGNNYIISKVKVDQKGESAVCTLNVSGKMNEKGHLAISLRPFNPEGISFIHEVSNIPSGWMINGKDQIIFEGSSYKQMFSNYKTVDVGNMLINKEQREKIKCDVGLCTAAAFFEIKPGIEKQIKVQVPLMEPASKSRKNHIINWSTTLDNIPRLKIPDEKMKYLYDTSIRTLILMSPGKVFAGPYTYKDFWFRDSVYAALAMLSLNLFDKVEDIIARFLKKQLPTGYFRSQDGEWDSNGQVLWIMRKFCELSGKSPDSQWEKPVIKAMNWIVRKRISGKNNKKVGGLLPPGFSAEHFGPNDYYYWDDFWSVAGLDAGVYILTELGMEDLAKKYSNEKESFLKSINASIEKVQKEQGITAIPASPCRRMDSSAIGIVSASYPLRIYGEQEERINNTVDYLIEKDFLKGLFFHEIAHSGMNIYLSLEIAQALLRRGDNRFFGIIESAANAATGTGQWPEAIHPWTGGGCMGDGQHLWASSEWILMLRNCFVREEKDKLIHCSGIPEQWINEDNELFFGPAATSFGEIGIGVKSIQDKVVIEISSDPEKMKKEAQIEIRMPGYKKTIVQPGERSVTLEKAE